MNWQASNPIYQQIKKIICDAILDGDLPEGENIPSIRKFSSGHQVNPLTVAKAYQLLVQDEILLKRRGQGMVVNANAKHKLLAQERERFTQLEWPMINKKIKRLGLTLEELINA